MTEDEVRKYLSGLLPGESVIETGESCMKGKRGTIYISQNEATKGSLCVRWEDGLGTSVTWGTRRISAMYVRVNKGALSGQFLMSSYVGDKTLYMLSNGLFEEWKPYHQAYANFTSLEDALDFVEAHGHIPIYR